MYQRPTNQMNSWLLGSGMAFLLSFGITGSGCGSDKGRPGGAAGVETNAEAGSGGEGSGGSGGQAANAGGAGTAGAAAGAAAGSSTTGTLVDAGVVVETPPIPEVGDTFLNEAVADSNEPPLVFPPDAGLVPNVEGVSVGAVDSTFGEASACLHIDMESGSYRVVPDKQSPDPRLERVAAFTYADGGFQIFSIYPWFVSFVVPSVAPDYVPTDSVVTVDVSREEVSLRVRLQVQGDSIVVLSVVVLSLSPAPTMTVDAGPPPT